MNVLFHCFFVGFMTFGDWASNASFVLLACLLGDNEQLCLSRLVWISKPAHLASSLLPLPALDPPRAS